MFKTLFSKPVVLELSWGWQCYFVDKSDEPKGELHIRRDGTISLAYGGDGWGFSNPKVQELYTKSIKLLSERGIVLPKPDERFSKIEKFSRRILRVSNMIDPTQDIGVSNWLVLLSYEDHKNDDARNMYIRIGEFKSKTEMVIPIMPLSVNQVTLFFNSLWEIRFSHFDPYIGSVTGVRRLGNPCRTIEFNHESTLWNPVVFLPNEDLIAPIMLEIDSLGYK